MRPPAVDLQHAFDQFLPEDTLATIAHPSDRLRACSRHAQMGIDRDRALAGFHPEGRLLMIVPADPVVTPSYTVDGSGRRAALQSLARLTIAKCRLLGASATAFIIYFGGCVSWSLRLPIRGARAAVVAIGRATRAAFHHGLAGLRQARVSAAGRRAALQSLARLTIAKCRLLGASATAFSIALGGRVIWSLRLPGRGVRMAVVAIERATRAALHHSLARLRQARVSAAYRFAAPTIIVASVLSAGAFAGTQWRAPLGMALAVPPLDVAPLAVAPIESRPAAFKSPPATIEHRVDAEPIRSQPTGTVTSTAEIQRLLNRYRDAYSTLDVSAVRAIWPSVDTTALRRAFDRLAEHNLEYDGCQMSVGDARVEAICRGIAQSLRVGDRTTVTEDRQWQFVLNRVGDRWLIASVHAR